MTMPAEPQRPAKRENVLTRKIGPLPTWAWVAILAAVILFYAWYRNRQQASSSVSASGSGQVPQFVNQTYTNVQPPTVGGGTTDKDTETDKDEDEDEQKKRKHKVKHRPKRHHPTHAPPRTGHGGEPGGGGPGVPRDYMPRMPARPGGTLSGVS